MSVCPDFASKRSLPEGRYEVELTEPLNLAANPPPGRGSILLVDDDPASLASLRAILGDLGLDLVEARSGEEALDRAKGREFAVILLDVRLPGLGGFDTAEAIRADERSRSTPIIFLAEDDGIDRDQVERGYALGAVDVLVKPPSPVVLRAKVRGLVTLYQEKQRARHEAEQLRLLVHGTTDYAIFMLDPEGRVATWNPGAERIKGYPAGEIIGQHFSRFYPQDAVERGWPEHELAVAAAEGRFEDEGWRLRKDGSRFWANVVITALRDERGGLQGFSKITRDLTERMQAEESLRRSEERFRHMIEGVYDYAIFMLDPERPHRHLERRGRADQAVQGRRDHRATLLEVLPAGGARPGLARPRIEGGRSRRTLRGRGVAGPQGRVAVLGQRRHHGHQGRAGAPARLLQDHP